jgi:hypothetical protein
MTLPESMKVSATRPLMISTKKENEAGKNEVGKNDRSSRLAQLKDIQNQIQTSNNML